MLPCNYLDVNKYVIFQIPVNITLPFTLTSLRWFCQMQEVNFSSTFIPFRIYLTCPFHTLITPIVITDYTSLNSRCIFFRLPDTSYNLSSNIPLNTLFLNLISDTWLHAHTKPTVQLQFCGLNFRFSYMIKKNNSKLNDLFRRIFKDGLLSPSKQKQRRRNATSGYHFTACHYLALKN